MIVLIEGVDGSGKTTLCNQLRFEGYVPLNIEQDDEQYIKYIIRANEGQIYICDRSFLSDLIYRLEDGKKRQGMDLSSMLEILNRNTKVIFCHSPTAYLDSMKRGEDNITSKPRNDAINHLYNIVYRMLKIFTNVPIMDYNWKSDELSSVIKFIEGRESDGSVHV